MKILKGIGICILSLILLSAAGYFYLVYINNIDAPAPSDKEIRNALDNSIDWVLSNQDELLKSNNPVLWWFISESASLTNNTELTQLVIRYRNTTLNRNSAWTGFWVKKPPFSYIPSSLDRIEKYQRFFVYALTCDIELASEKIIQAQFNINYCDWRPYYSSCITHQMMGIRFLQMKNCGNQTLNEKLSIKLADLVEKQLIWDPRVGDVYIQRVMMLVESGNLDKVNPTWLHNIIKEQLDDGGWASFDPIFPLYDDKYFGFSYKFFDIRTPTSNFHPTAQAIYLLSLLRSQ